MGVILIRGDTFFFLYIYIIIKRDCVRRCTWPVSVRGKEGCVGEGVGVGGWRVLLVAMAMVFTAFAASLRRQAFFFCVCVCVCFGGWGVGVRGVLYILLLRHKTSEGIPFSPNKNTSNVSWCWSIRSPRYHSRTTAIRMGKHHLASVAN